MRIDGVESLLFGVEDMDACARACTDFGLVEAEDIAGPRRSFEARDGSSIVLHAIDDPVLPPTQVAGPTLRMVIWGVPDVAALDAISAELEKDREVRREGDMIVSHDDNGMWLAFRVSTKRKLDGPTPAGNIPGHHQRPVNSRAIDAPRKVQPLGIAHVVFDCANERKARAFYVERLGFIVSDSFRDVGAFIRTATAREHHSMFTVQRTPAGLNHVAFYVTDFSEVMVAGIGMEKAGWKVRWGPGRHKLGSNYFWYFHTPLGGALEYTCDVDHVDENWQPLELEFSPENSAIWSAQGVMSGI